MLKVEDFLKKYNKELLMFNDKEDILQCNIKESQKFKVENVEDAEDYKIFKIVNLENKREEFFLFTKRSWNVFKIDYKDRKSVV